MLKTRVGYTGGSKNNPSYHSLGDHTETVQVLFDPKVVSYEILLNQFFDNHNFGIKKKRQYKSAIWYQNESEKKLIESKMNQLTKQGRNVATTVNKLGVFYLAETYHQKYYNKPLRLKRETWDWDYETKMKLENSTNDSETNLNQTSQKTQLIGDKSNETNAETVG